MIHCGTEIVTNSKNNIPMSFRSLCFVFLVIFGFNFTSAQRPYQPQPGQRGYVPTPKNIPRQNLGLKDVQKELEVIIPACVLEFNFDEFEKEIFKQLLTRKIEGENALYSSESITRDDRRKALIQIDKDFYSEVSSIMTPEEIERFKVMDFDKEKKEKKKEKRRKKKKNKS